VSILFDFISYKFLISSRSAFFFRRNSISFGATAIVFAISLFLEFGETLCDFAFEGYILLFLSTGKFRDDL